MKVDVVLTGGGTAGHVMPNLEVYKLFPELEFAYIGSIKIEEDLVKSAGIKFYKIKSGKLRRYFSIQNFLDIFKIFVGFIQVFFLLGKLRPKLVFSKGGFVSVPVVVAAKLRGIKVVSHESDLSPGLATKINARFSHQVWTTFSDTKKYLNNFNNIVYRGPIVRSECFESSSERGRDFLGFSSNKPILLVMGGSLGSLQINTMIDSLQSWLFENFCVVHLTGKNKETTIQHSNYKQFDFIYKEIFDLIACADIVVSRAGSNAIFELLALQKPMVLIPLVQGSRGDQVLNANFFEKNDWAYHLKEDELDPLTVQKTLLKALNKKDKIKEKQLLFAREMTPKKLKEKILDLL